mmetsp:Transcript_13268/g.19032  ORF Transcript_13268/g.19032 Transcript_13268/m.19032 type:complete len:261 (-) Transcript_13268:1120-1902(-)
MHRFVILFPFWACWIGSWKTSSLASDIHNDLSFSGEESVAKNMNGEEESSASAANLEVVDVVVPPQRETTLVGSGNYYCQDHASCNHKCSKDSDCLIISGRYSADICCNKCGNYKGTAYYKRCYNPSNDESTTTPSPTPPSCQDTDSCNRRCSSDNDCLTASRYGAEVCCSKCNKNQGTMGYRRCFNPSSPTSAPTTYYYDNDDDDDAPTDPKYFPPAGENCRKKCKTDADCRDCIGYNHCRTCGKNYGTVMYGRCYNDY